MMKTTSLWIALSLFFASLLLQAQTATKLKQSLRGQIFDADAGVPLPGASVVVLGTSPLVGAQTDENGYFKIDNLPVGRYVVKVSYIGYSEQILPNVQVNSGKQTELNTRLKEHVVQGTEVVVEQSRNKTEVINDIATVSVKGFSPEETRRYAGSLNDPSRMASSFAGVVGNPSGSNDIIVRGNSPRGMLWRMEGLEIPNPNHFSDEGSSGGPINIINPNVLGHSGFYTGAFPANFGNASSGVFDLKLRNGNKEKSEYVFQAGVIGIEAGAEGPFKPGSQATYLVNYRYSTLAMMNKTGLKISGDDEPVFQDGSFKVRLPTKKAGIFSVYGIGGYSTVYSPFFDTKKVKREEFNGSNTMWATGINHLLFLSTKTTLESNIGSSGTGRNFKFKSNSHSAEDPLTLTGKMNNQYQNLRFNTALSHKWNAKHKMDVGVTYSILQFNIRTTEYDFDNRQTFEAYRQKGTTGLFQPFANWQFRPNDRLTINTGAHLMHFGLVGQTRVEPRLGVAYQANPRHIFTYGAGLHSRIEPVSTYFARENKGEMQNKNLKTGRAFHQVAGHQVVLNEKSTLKTEIYFQQLNEVPIGVDSMNYYSTLNEIDAWNTTRLVNKGLGRNYGMDVTYERMFSDNYYVTVTQSVYRSEFKNPDFNWKPTRYDGRYVTNVLLGKEFALRSGSSKERTLVLNGRLFYSGAFNYTPVDEQQSREANRTVFNEREYMGKKGSNITRIDFAIGLRTNRAKTTQTLKLDIYNVLNQTAVLGEYYNSYSNKIEVPFILGILPNLMYRIEF